jgi:hypothetical protein
VPHVHEHPHQLYGVRGQRERRRHRHRDFVAGHGQRGFVAAPPVDMLKTGTPQVPVPVPDAVIAFPDGSTVTANALGNFDASAVPWTLANQAIIAAGTQVEVVVDASDRFPLAAPGNAFIDVDEPAGLRVAAFGSRSTEASPSPKPSPTPVVVAKLQVQPASDGMYDKEQRTFSVFAFDKTGKKVQLGTHNVSWTVANCSGAAAAGKLAATTEKSKILPRARNGECRNLSRRRDGFVPIAGQHGSADGIGQGVLPRSRDVRRLRGHRPGPERQTGRESAG